MSAIEIETHCESIEQALDKAESELSPRDRLKLFERVIKLCERGIHNAYDEARSNKEPISG